MQDGCGQVWCRPRANSPPLRVAAVTVEWCAHLCERGEVTSDMAAGFSMAVQHMDGTDLPVLIQIWCTPHWSDYEEGGPP
jgi:hypothetical protein